MIMKLCPAIIFILLLFPCQLFADNTIGKEIEKEWFLREKDPETFKRIKEKGFGEYVGNIEEISSALVNEGYRTFRSNPDKALTLFQGAKDLSPDYPPAYYATGKAYWYQSALNIFKTLDEFLSGWKASIRNFWWSFFALGNLSFSLTISVLLSFLMFSILMTIRYSPLLNHDIKERLPALQPFHIKIASLILLLFFLILNPGFLYLMILFILWPYLSIKEKGIGLFSIIIFAIFSMIIPYLLLFTTVQNTPELKVMVEGNKGWIDDRGLAELEERLKKEPEDPEAAFSLALTQKRRGNFNKALTLYQKAAERRYLIDRVYNNIGNVYAAKKNFNEAISYYHKALDANPDLVSAHYNLSQIYREIFRFEEGEKEYQEAGRIDPELLKTYTSVKGLSFNRLVMDEGLSKKEIWRNILRRAKENNKLADSFWLRFMKWVPRRMGAIVLFIVSLLFLSYGFLIRNKSSTYSCVKCGEVVCNRCQGITHAEDMCERCYKILIKMEGTSQNRIERILQIRKFQDTRKAILKIIAFLPGINPLYSGKPIHGIFSWSSFIILVNWWFFWDYLKTPFKIYPVFPGLATVSFLLFSLIVYVLLFINERKVLR